MQRASCCAILSVLLLAQVALAGTPRAVAQGRTQRPQVPVIQFTGSSMLVVFGLLGAATAAGMIGRRILTGSWTSTANVSFQHYKPMIGLGLVALWFLSAGYWPVSVIILVWLVVSNRRTVQGRTDSYGSARWANLRDFKAFGMLGDQGLILGRYGKHLLRIDPQHINHAVCIGPSGCGKGVSVLTPNLLWGWNGAAVVFDPKFELFKLTAGERSRHGKVMLLDPLGASGRESCGFNPLLHIDPASPRVIEDSRALATALVIRDPEEREKHWADSAETILTAFTAFTIVRARPDQRHLHTVVDLISNEDSYRGVLKIMQDSPDMCGGMLSRLAHQIARIEGKELGSVLSTVFQHVSFLNSPAMKKHLACGADEAFDPRDLLDNDNNVTVYIGLPADQLRPMSRVLRLQLTSIFQTFMRAGPDPNRSCMVFLDEAAQLGHLPILEDAVCLLRGYGIKTFSFFQSAGSVSEIFPGEKARTFLSNMDFTQYFQPNDYDTAEDISKRLGDSTISVTTANGGRGTSESQSMSGSGRQDTGGGSTNDGWSVQETGRRLMMPEEVLRMGTRSQVVFTKHLPPIYADTIRWYSDPAFSGYFRDLKKRNDALAS